MGAEAVAARVGAALLIVGFLGLVAPYTGELLGLDVKVEPIVEIVDHVVPGAVVVGVAGVILATKRIPLVAALAATLGGFWMTATHVPLLAQAADGSAGWGAGLWHTTPGVILLILSAIATALAWKTSPSA